MDVFKKDMILKQIASQIKMNEQILDINLKLSELMRQQDMLISDSIDIKEKIKELAMKIARLELDKKELQS